VVALSPEEVTGWSPPLWGGDGREMRRRAGGGAFPSKGPSRAGGGGGASRRASTAASDSSHVPTLRSGSHATSRYTVTLRPGHEPGTYWAWAVGRRTLFPSPLPPQGVLVRAAVCAAWPRPLFPHGWIYARLKEEGAGRRVVSLVTGVTGCIRHRDPLAACGPPGSWRWPVIARCRAAGGACGQLAGAGYSSSRP
jgi:hypothetical protein